MAYLNSHTQKDASSVYYLATEPIFYDLFIFIFFMCIGVKVFGTGVTDSCELPCGCWELNPGPLEEQSVLLTAEPSFQPQASSSLMTHISSETRSLEFKQTRPVASEL